MSSSSRSPRLFAPATRLLLAALCLVSGCQLSVAQTPSGTSGAQRQLIIKFRAGTIACDASGIAAFAAASRTQLTFVRPMSGDACVVQHRAADLSHLSAEEAVLARHPAVEWVEPDSPARAQ